jgi:hypothetical protein
MFENVLPEPILPLQRIPPSSIAGAASSRAHGAGKVRGSASGPISESREDILRKLTDRIVPMPFGPAADHLGDEIECDCFERILRPKNLALLCGFAFERRIAAIGDYVPRLVPFCPYRLKRYLQVGQALATAPFRRRGIWD